MRRDKQSKPTSAPRRSFLRLRLSRKVSTLARRVTSSGPLGAHHRTPALRANKLPAARSSVMAAPVTSVAVTHAYSPRTSSSPAPALATPALEPQETHRDARPARKRRRDAHRARQDPQPPRLWVAGRQPPNRREQRNERRLGAVPAEVLRKIGLASRVGDSSGSIPVVALSPGIRPALRHPGCRRRRARAKIEQSKTGLRRRGPVPGAARSGRSQPVLTSKAGCS